jgi:UDP-hydrolysing UDP-N-acetyl-D-glucosamine 2-epimerase
MGQAMAGFADAMAELSPDIVMLSGDRAETLVLCVTAAYMGLPIAHVQAGDKSGHIDDAARYAIAKLAHIHLASCEDSAQRLRRLGEEDFRIFEVGAPQLDDMNRDFSAERITHDGADFELLEPYVILMQHPVMAEREEIEAQMRASIAACLESGLRVFWIYPNSDLGYRQIMSVLEEHKGNARVILISNLRRDAYLTLLHNAQVLVGNSSSGILEAPSFKVPVVNVGNRQRGRPQASNILNCEPQQEAIATTLQTALTDSEFRSRCASAVNPYGDGRSGPRICEILSTIPLDGRLMDKVTTF